MLIRTANLGILCEALDKNPANQAFSNSLSFRSPMDESREGFPGHSRPRNAC